MAQMLIKRLNVHIRNKDLPIFKYISVEPHQIILDNEHMTSEIRIQCSSDWIIK